jgi:hypothetical protein
MFPGNIPIYGNARRCDRIVPSDRDLTVESPGFSVERPTHHFENVHRPWPSPGGDGRSSGRRENMIVKRDEAELGSIEIDPESLRAAEFMQAQMILDSMVGKTIVRAEIEDTRIAVTTDDGITFFFYGFMGEHLEPSGDESADEG